MAYGSLVGVQCGRFTDVHKPFACWREHTRLDSHVLGVSTIRAVEGGTHTLTHT